MQWTSLSTAAALIGYLTAIGGGVAVVWRVGKEFGKIMDGVKCQLRSGMLHTYYKHREDRTIRQYELENFMLQYKAYKAMKGNSFIDDVYQEVVSWEMLS